MGWLWAEDAGKAQQHTVGASSAAQERVTVAHGGALALCRTGPRCATLGYNGALGLATGPRPSGHRRVEAQLAARGDLFIWREKIKGPPVWHLMQL